MVWSGPEGGGGGFQLCYDKMGKERALTWTPLAGFTHALVESGEESPLANETPILTVGGDFPVESVKQQFLWRSSEMPPQLREEVIKRLDEYPLQRGPEC